MGRLNNLKALIHKGGGVNGNLLTHLPGGVSQGIGQGYALKVGLSPSIEWTARCSENKSLNLRLLTRTKGLEDCGMLAVHGNDLHAAFLCKSHNKLTCDNKRLLVCKGKSLARLNGGKGGRKACLTENGVNDRIGRALGNSLTNPCPARGNLDTRVTEGHLKAARGGLVSHSQYSGLELTGGSLRSLIIRACGNNIYFISPGSGNLLCLNTDRACCAEDCNCLTHKKPRL